jgi:predicted acyl esterase
MRGPRDVDDRRRTRSGSRFRPSYDAREHYTKYEYLIPMRDGVNLFASVLVPKDASKTYPSMIVRTPFGIVPYGTDEY